MTPTAAFEKVPFATVHKEYDEDVLVANMRGLAPAWIPAELIDAPALNGDERELLRGAYSVERVDAEQAGRVLALRTLPERVRAERAADLSKAARQALERCYAPQRDGWSLAEQFPSELDHVTLMGELAERGAHLTDAERHELSRVLDKLPALARPPVSCFNMVVDTRNYFFYRKHHEHVPGIMLIEAVRQAMYAQYYRHGAYAKGQVSLTVESLHIDFTGFVNANFPVRIEVADRRAAEAAAADSSEERIATVSQQTSVVATARMRAKPIKMTLFKRLRNVSPPEGARFFPCKNIAPMGIFVWPSGATHEGAIHDLSLGGLKAGFPEAASVKVGATAEVSMFVEQIGYIRAQAEVRWVQRGAAGLTAGLRFAEPGTTARSRLRETIKNFTYVDVSRGAH